ncbi:MAG TPA: hypothetical protein PLD74_12895 [Prolixibacteraceae bacterium]|nr:hypothetical protein [Prolixibacteraceae bacterium]
MNETQYQAGAAIVDEGIKFKVPLFWGIKKTFLIRPLRPGTLVRISQQQARMKPLVEDENMVHELLGKGTNLRHVATMIALAAINRPILSRIKLWWYRWILLNYTEKTADMFAYQSLVLRQMDAQFFFLIMASAKKMTFLEPKTTTEPSQVGARSGVPSASSRKPSA